MSRGRVVLYQSAAAAVRARIEADGLKPDDRVGASLEEMAGEYRVGVGTMRKALAVLAEEGVVQTIQGKGTFVATRPEVSEDPALAELRDRVDDHDDRLAAIYARMGWPYAGRERAQDERDDAGGARRLPA